MASFEETAAITRVLLSLVDAVNELDAALLELSETESNKKVTDHIKLSQEAKNQSLEHIKTPVALMEKNREQR